ncbi:hypothetical protein GDO86_017644 [Hymenochirus boettgeri]|uniref:Uncharacterized protein n=1 Tax=Hymenochirus boettgeri TaxID=247094 RepID=A0A8T2IN93_9PIPI|nr:hypothetical protein GDO86_017644 [Hymenochirus boettgeri]
MTERRDPQVLLVNGGVTEEAYVLIEPNLSPTPISSSAQSKPRSSALSCTPRHLAILSIVCGFSCVGIKALLLAVKVKLHVWFHLSSFSIGCLT